MSAHGVASNRLTWLYALLSLIFVVGHSGIWPMPNLYGQFLVSQSLTALPFSDSNTDYIFSNYLQPMLYGLVGGNSLFLYAVYAGLVTVFYLILFVLWFVKYHGEEVALKELKLMGALVFPMFFIPFYWVGMDGMTLFLMLVTMMVIRQKWAFFSAFLLGVQHFEQGLIGFSLLAFSLLLLVLVKNRKPDTYALIKSVALILVGIIAGKLMLMGWFDVNDIHMRINRASWVEERLPSLIHEWTSNWYFILWSILGVGWIWVALFIQRLWPFVIGVVFALLLTAIVGDQTRVGVIVTFPMVFYWMLMDKTIWEKVSVKQLSLVVALYLLIPVIVVWGKPYSSLLGDDKRLIEKVARGQSGVMTYDWLSPFIDNAPKGLLEPKPVEHPVGRLELEGRNDGKVCGKDGHCELSIQARNLGTEVWPAWNDGKKRFEVVVICDLTDSLGNVNQYQKGFPMPLGQDMSARVVFSFDLKEPGDYNATAYLYQQGVGPMKAVGDVEGINVSFGFHQ